MNNLKEDKGSSSLQTSIGKTTIPAKEDYYAHDAVFSTLLRSPPHVSGYLNPQLFLSGYGYLPHESGESGRQFRNFLNRLFRVEIFEYAMNPEYRMDAKLGYFFIRRHNKIKPSSLP